MYQEMASILAEAAVPAGIMAVAILVDRLLGDPPNRYHPTAWAGGMIARMIPAFGDSTGAPRRLWGVVVVVASCVVVAVLATLALWVIAVPAVLAQPAIGDSRTGDDLHLLAAVSWVAIIAVYAATILLLKSTIAVRGMERHAAGVSSRLEEGDVRGAGGRLASIVKRDTASMSQGQICSGVVESVAENTVDGVTGPLFYFGVFGLPGALIYRTINTIDSMAGYRTRMFGDVGWFGAKCDTVLNWAPSRLTGHLMVLAAAVLGYDWRGAYRAMSRDAGKPDSLNSGYPMAAMAGALNVTLEKPHHYTIGNGRDPGVGDIRAAVRIMKSTVWLFAGLVCVPLMVAGTALLSLIIRVV